MNSTQSSRNPYENRGSSALLGGPCAVAAPPVTPRLVVLTDDFDNISVDLHGQVSALEAAVERIGGQYQDVNPGKQLETNGKIAVVAPAFITLRLDRALADLHLLRSRLNEVIKRLHSLA